jgi:hypothetical protein
MDRRIGGIVLRTLAKEREARFQSAHEVRTHLAAVFGGLGADVRGHRSQHRPGTPIDQTRNLLLAVGS